MWRVLIVWKDGRLEYVKNGACSDDVAEFETQSNARRVGDVFRAGLAGEDVLNVEAIEFQEGSQ